MKKSSLALAIYAGLHFVAASANANVLERIEVTAQKRTQSVQEVGIAITAVSGEQMEQLGWDGAEDVVTQTPGVTLVQPNGPSSFYINIRGVAQNDFSGDNQESPVAVYVDDVYVASPSGAGFQLFDFERVEVLRGPQGTLFGRNATGGLVHYITKRPSFDPEGYIKTTIGDFNQFDVEGAVSGGLSEKVAARLSFAKYGHDGFIENRNQTVGDLNDNDTWAVRGQLLFDISDDTELLLNVRAGKLNNTNAPFEHSVARANAQGLGELITDPNVLDLTGGDVETGNIYTSHQDYGYRDPDGGKIHSGEYNTPGHIQVETKGYTATLKTDIADMEFVSITDFNTLKRDYLEDSDASPRNFFSFALKSDNEQFSQEFRLSGQSDDLRWTTGAYYMKYDGDMFIGGAAGGFAQAAFGALLGQLGVAPADVPSVFPDTFGFNSPFSFETKSTAVYAQFEYDLAEDLVLTTGLRWSKEEKETEFIQYFSDFDSPVSSTVVTEDFLGIGPYWRYSNGSYSNIGAYTFEGGAIPLLEGDAETEISDSFVTAKLGLNWHVSKDTMLYVSYNRGVKAGGFNAPLDATLYSYGGLTPDKMNFDKEVLNAYEVGFKTEIYDGKARLNGSTYYYDYKDYQAFSLESLTTYVFNTDAQNYGADIELQMTPMEGLDVLLGAAYINTNVEDAYKTPSGESLDREMIVTPELSLNGMLRYEWPLSNDGGSFAAQYDFNYMSDHFFQLKNAPIGEEDGYILSNVRVTYYSQERDWSISAFVNNVTDEEYRTMVFDLSGHPSAGGFGAAENYYGKGRWWGLSFRYDWE